jgi:hypothetical protein
MAGIRRLYPQPQPRLTQSNSLTAYAAHAIDARECLPKIANRAKTAGLRKSLLTPGQSGIRTASRTSSDFLAVCLGCDQLLEQLHLVYFTTWKPQGVVSFTSTTACLILIGETKRDLATAGRKPWQSLRTYAYCSPLN